MERKPHSTSSILGAIVLLVVALLALYVGGYFAMGKRLSAGIIVRRYAFDWHASVYRPLTRLEAAATGKEVWISGPTTTYNSDGEVYVMEVGSEGWPGKFQGDTGLQPLDR